MPMYVLFHMFNEEPWRHGIEGFRAKNNKNAIDVALDIIEEEQFISSLKTLRKTLDFEKEGLTVYLYKVNEKTSSLNQIL